MIYLDPLSEEQAEIIRQERNDLPSGILRTPFQLTHEQQMDWYHQEVCDRRSTTRYWALMAPFDKTHKLERMVGYGGIENIQWENGIAEMSLLIRERERGNGYGAEAVELFLEQSFDEMGLDTVFAEVYACNPNLKFWFNLDWDTESVLPRRKRANGRLYESHIFTWKKEYFYAG